MRTARLEVADSSRATERLDSYPPRSMVRNRQVDQVNAAAVPAMTHAHAKKDNQAGGLTELELERQQL